MLLLNQARAEEKLLLNRGSSRFSSAFLFLREFLKTKLQFICNYYIDWEAALSLKAVANISENYSIKKIGGDLIEKDFFKLTKDR